LEQILFIVYLVGILVLINIIPFLKKSALGKGLLSSLFFIKVLAGLAYAWFYTLPKYNAGSDTWRFYRLSLEETKWLLKDPVAFTKDLFVFGYSNAGNLFAGEKSYWNDLKSNVLVKLMACMNVITNNSYYTNIILFNFLFFIGLVAFYRVFKDIFPDRKLLLVAGLFLLPSTLFWCSGIHKDGLILSALGSIMYCFYTGLKTRFSIIKIFVITLCLVLIFSLRNYVAIAMLPALFCWYITAKLPQLKANVFIVVFLTGSIIFFSAKYVSPKLDFPSYITQKRTEFSKLEGTSTVYVDTLKPTLFGFIHFLPNAFDMALLRPHITEAKNVSYLPAALENLLLLLISGLSIVYGTKKDLYNPTILFCLFLSISLLSLAGYTITLSGAIVRYKSISLPLLITPMLCIISIKKSHKEVLV
jgi:hypothetical protein